MKQKTTGRTGRRAVLSVAFAACCLLATRAEAEGDMDEEREMLLIVSTVLVSLSSGPGTIVFSVPDIVYSARGQWLPPDWAITQIILGSGPNLLASVGYTLMVTTIERDRMPNDGAPYIALAVVHGVLAAGFATHAALSLAYYRKPNKQPRPAARGRSCFWASAAPLTGGGVAVVGGRF